MTRSSQTLQESRSTAGYLHIATANWIIGANTFRHLTCIKQARDRSSDFAFSPARPVRGRRVNDPDQWTHRHEVT
ncbi:hypothetical protein [Paraburkholderia terricola]|uniref:Uncharacterized protein n=1 Tax=Paraburkholderia terricola TaxID=169427 RepID=A0ABU1M0V8_9BURK|nr:hypothetical protein [Paraburkholderia terricola]MDR6412630.1 hypothetical protein [Paraburkholderia terricola]MDR6485050.1 hypothetical protein [Paraburkholderia terricola]